MREAIINFHNQLSFQPVITNAKKLSGFSPKVIVIGGMGGSALAGEILKLLRSDLTVCVHRNYGIPQNIGVPENDTLLVAVSYSGNTEETINFAEHAHLGGHKLVVITTGGTLGNWADARNVPMISIPLTGIQPRLAIGYMLSTLASAIQDDNLLREMQELAPHFKPAEYEALGISLAEKIGNKIPITYASEQNSAISYIWKIKFNETAKVPAYQNEIPELNHNELAAVSEENLQAFHFIFIYDKTDDARIINRMRLTEDIYREAKASVSHLTLEGKNQLGRICCGIVLADWVALKLAQMKGVLPDKVKIIEEFKVSLAKAN